MSPRRLLFFHSTKLVNLDETDLDSNTDTKGTHNIVAATAN
jgi:hypothetical protein